jgi:hypothetical protein
MTRDSTKRRVGRPSKFTKTDEEVEILGVVDSPNDDKHVVEFFITRPAIFKKLLTCYSDYEADMIRLSFTADKLTMSFYGHGFKLMTVIDGHKCNRYYCKEPIDVYIDCDSFLRCANQIEQEYDYEFELAVAPIVDDASSGRLRGGDKHIITMYVYNKTTKEHETTVTSENNPENKSIGPIFGDVERTWPIAFSSFSKSYKRKFVNLVKNYNHEAVILSDNVAKRVTIETRDRGSKNMYAINLPSLVLPENENAEDAYVSVDLRPFRMFLKNAVDEMTTFHINSEKIACLTAEFGKIKNRGDAIGIVKFYCWSEMEDVHAYLPPDELLRVTNEDEDEEEEKKPVKKKKAVKKPAKKTRKSKKADVSEDEDDDDDE